MLEHTGDLLSQFEEGNAKANGGQTETTSFFEEDIIHSDLISDPVEDSSKKTLLRVWRTARKKQKAQILCLRLWMMAWNPTLGDPIDPGTHQNF